MKAYFDTYGRLRHQAGAEEVAGMSSPVRCNHCYRIYDLGMVKVTQRYADCSVWKSPCCMRTVDDRGPGWKSFPDFERIKRSELPPTSDPTK